jgi:hypothetical protein
VPIYKNTSAQSFIDVRGVARFCRQFVGNSRTDFIPSRIRNYYSGIKQYSFLGGIAVLDLHVVQAILFGRFVVDTLYGINTSSFRRYIFYSISSRFANQGVDVKCSK